MFQNFLNYLQLNSLMDMRIGMEHVKSVIF